MDLRCMKNQNLLTQVMNAYHNDKISSLGKKKKSQYWTCVLPDMHPDMHSSLAPPKELQTMVIFAAHPDSFTDSPYDVDCTTCNTPKTISPDTAEAQVDWNSTWHNTEVTFLF